MAGIFALSINPERYKDRFLDDLFWGTFYVQHFGEDYAGLSTYSDKKGIKIRTHRGLFRPTFSEDMESMDGTEGIGYCGLDREPFLVSSRLGKFSICFSGNIINLTDLEEEFEKTGHVFQRADDIEIIAKLIVQKDNIIEGIFSMAKRVLGAYSLLILCKEGIYAVRSPMAHFPLVIGEKEGAMVVSSSSSGFRNINFGLFRDLQPGEIVLMKNDSLKTKGKIEGKRVQFCSFFWVYTAFPSAIIEKIPASLVRKRLGAALARRDIKKGFIPDIVVPMPESGRFHAIGYHQEFCLAASRGEIKKIPLYDELLIKYPYTGRSFIPRHQKDRDKEDQVKILETGEDFKGKIVVICGDSIVRGTQIERNLVPKLKKAGIRKIHLRISNPELLSYCPWEKATKEGELFSSRFSSIKEKIRFLGVESLEYNSIDDLLKAIGLPKEKLCVDCILNK